MTIYSPQGTELLDAPVSKSAIVKNTLMGDYYIELPFNLYEQQQFPKGSYILYKGFKFKIKENVNPDFDNKTGGWKYTLKFWARQNDMKDVRIKWTKATPAELIFNNTTDLLSFGNIVANTMNAFEGGSDWVVGSIPSDLTEQTKLISFNGDTCWDALAQIAQTFDVEWWCEENGSQISIHFGKLEFGSEEEFKRGDVITSLPARKGDSSNYGTRFFVYGSTRNLPDDYTDSEESGITNHVSQKRLHLPSGYKFIDAWENLAKDDIVEQIAIFDDIYPKNTETATGIETIPRLFTGGEDGKEQETFDAYVMKCDNTPFVPSDIIENETLQAQFTSGTLNGRTFDLAIIDDNNNPIDPADWKPEDGFNKKFEIIHQEEDSGGAKPLIIPNASLHPEVGDTFVLIGVRLPAERTEAAEQELLKAGLSWAKKNSMDTDLYECPTNPVYCHENEKNYDLGQKVLLIDPRFGPTGRSSRIQGYEKRLYNEYIATYTVGDNTAYSRFGTIERDVAASAYSERFGVSNGKGVYLIQSQYDTTQPTNYNAYSALASDKRYLNKQTGGKVNGTLINDDFRSSNFAEGEGLTGAGLHIYEDANGDAVIVTDKLIVRKDTKFNNLVINQISFSRGENIFTEGGCEITSVEEPAGYDYYRCYYDNENGSRYAGIVVGDQVRCQRYDEYYKDVAKYYWRLCVGVGDNYIDLSKTDFDGSGLPEAGDNLVQFGNRTDKTRQSAIVIDPHNGGRMEVYNGVDSYSLSDKNMAAIGTNAATGKAYIYGYGDIHIGNRNIDDDGAEYLKYDEANGLTIAGKISVLTKFQRSDGSYSLLSKYVEQIDDYQYIKRALIDGSTEISGGLVLTSLIQLGLNQSDGYHIFSGINGVVDASKKGNGIAAWYGGNMVDHEADPNASDWAKSLYRFDGSGYIAGGNISWNADGSGFVGRDKNGNPVVKWDSSGVSLSNEIKLGTSEETLSSIIGFMTKFNNMFELETISVPGNLDENGKPVVKTVIKAKYDGLYTEGFLSALGVNPDTGGGGGASYLRDLLDVNLSTPTNGQVLTYSGGKWVNMAAQAGATALSALTDVALSSLSSGQVLTYEAGRWVNKAPSSVDLSGYLTTASASSTYVNKSGDTMTGTLTLTAATPLAVTSSTLVDNLNADLLDGQQGSWYQKHNLFFHRVAGASATVSVNPDTDLDGGGIIRNYYSAEAWAGTVPSGIGWAGMVLALNDHVGQLALMSQLAWDIAGKAWFRVHKASGYTDWREFAFTDSTVSKANQLATARLLWGQIFDGTGNVSGNMTGVGEITGTDGRHYVWPSVGYTVFGDKNPVEYQVIVRGKNILLQAEVGRYDLFISNETANVGIGTAYPAYKAHVDGTFYASGAATIGSTLSVSGAATFNSTVKIGGATLSWDAANKALKIDTGFYSENWISALGSNASSGGGTGTSYDRLDSWGDYTSAKAGWVLSAALGYDLHTRTTSNTNNITSLLSRVSSLEAGSALDFSTSGSGNVVTEISKSGTKVTVTKGLTAVDTSNTIIDISGNYTGKIYDIPCKRVFSGNNIVDAPAAGWTQGIVLASNNNNSHYQTCLVENNGKWYATRDYSNGMMTNWKQVAYLSDLSAYITTSAAASTYVKKSGDTMTGDLTMPRLISTVATGAAPFSVASQTLVSNLNADLLDGVHESGLMRGGLSNANVTESIVYRMGGYSLSSNTIFTPPHNGPFIGFGISSHYRIIHGDYNADTLRTRRYQDGEWGDWKTIAFTDSNVSSATRLQGSYSLWGQNFYGNNVSGNMTGVGEITGTDGRHYVWPSVGYTVFGDKNPVEYQVIVRGKNILLQAEVGRYDLFISNETANVGIGTAYPAYKAHVDGTFYASGAAAFGASVSVSGEATLHNVTLAGALAPDETGTRSIGSASKAFNNIFIRNIYSSGTSDTDGSSNSGSIRTEGGLSVAKTIWAGLGIWSSGYVSALGQNTSSDERLKEFVGNVDLTVEQIAFAPSKVFRWKSNGKLAAGSVAQYWQRIMPHSVTVGRNGFLEMQYGNIALVSAISVARKVVDHEQRIQWLERENRALRKEIERLKAA